MIERETGGGGEIDRDGEKERERKREIERGGREKEVGNQNI